MTSRQYGPMPRRACACGNHVWTNIGKAFVLLVSPEDAGLLDTPWSVSSVRKNSLYVSAHRRTKDENGRSVMERLHRVIMAPSGDDVVDHLNLNSLDNRRQNMRVCSPQQNMLNRRAYAGKAVPLKGVQFVKKTGRYKAVIRFEKKLYHLGDGYRTAEEAHAAYVAKARELHGPFFRAA